MTLLFSLLLVLSNTAAFGADLGRGKDDVDRTCADLKTAPIHFALTILSSKPTKTEAEASAKVLSKLVGVPYRKDTEHPRNDNCGGGCLTVESSGDYLQLKPGLFIVVGEVDGSDPELTKRFKAAVPDMYVKRSQIKGDKGGYGATSQCFETRILVGARTDNIKEAMEIAEMLAKATGVPFVPGEGIAVYYGSRCKTYPCITVEKEAVYSELDEGTGYLVILDEDRDAPSHKIDAKALDAARALAPKAYVAKLAFHVCGA